MRELLTKFIKKRSLAKIQWGVRAFQEWRSHHIDDSMNYDSQIFETNLDDIESLMKGNLLYSLCKFIPEVMKVKDGSPYPGATLYQMIIAIQQHISEKGLNWKLLNGIEFANVKVVLDNVMKERARENIGMVKRQAQVISYEFEKQLWERNILGEDSPDKLRDTVLFLIGINCGLRAGDEHHDLRRETPTMKLQFAFQRNDDGKQCLVYTEDTVMKTNDGGMSSMKKQRKVVWIYPSENINRCPVRLIDKYISLCPQVKNDKVKSNFYLRALEKTNLAQWYSNRVVGRNTLRQIVGHMLKDSKLDVFFSNHSLRCSRTTRLFQAGVDRKLVKEYSGHMSDVVDQYQVTSDKQRQNLSEILQGLKVPTLTSNSRNEVAITVSQKGNDDKNYACTSERSGVDENKISRIGEMINQIINAKKGVKTMVKVEVVFEG